MTRALRNLFARGAHRSPAAAGLAKPGRAGVALFATAVVFAPSLLLWHLHGVWNPNGAYAYAWVVPALALFLFKSRWDDRPPPSAPLEYAAWAAILLALATLPVRWLLETAPERTVCAFPYAVAAILISLSLLSIAGGASWLKWFSFPFVFILTTIPWPHRLEVVISNFLMRGVAGATVDILCLIGIPSVQSGNLVHIETGVIDIDEACSGIRSLQAMVMLSLFLGELFRLKLAARLWLLALGLTFTMLANVLRTVTLSAIGFAHGMSAVDRCHDATGLAVLILSLSCTLVAAFLIRPAMAPAPVPNAPGFGWPLPLKLSAALLIWFFVEEISVEAWYRSHEPKWRGWSWAVQWPRSGQDFHFIEIPKRSLQDLMCDESSAAAWKDADGSAWSLYWLRWNRGNAAAEGAKVHRPDLCFTAAGAILEKDAGMFLVSAGPMQFPFHSYTFRIGEKTLHVFFGLYEETPEGPALVSNSRSQPAGILQRAIKGQRGLGQQTLEIAVSGYRSESDARKALGARLGKLMQTRPELASDPAYGGGATAPISTARR